MKKLTAEDIQAYRDSVGDEEFNMTLAKLERQKAYLDDVDSPFAKEVLEYLERHIAYGMDGLIRDGNDVDRGKLKALIDMASYIGNVQKSYELKLKEIVKKATRNRYYK
jgi:hypothetical protein